MIVKTDGSFAALGITPPLSPPVVHNSFPHDAALVDGDAAPDELLDVERDGELCGLPQRGDHAHPARLHLLQRELRPRLLPVLLQTIHQFSQSVFAIIKKAPTRTFSWLKAPTSTFTFKTLLRHYAKWALTPQKVDMTLGPRRNCHKGRAVTFASATQFHVYLP